jgi:hypothetical protein
MPNSSISLDSLSSPSPSPEPADPNLQPPIDDGSELSELTEDDADIGPTQDGRQDKDMSEDDDQDDDDQDDDDDDDHPDHHRPSRRNGRKKRGIGSPNAWGWYGNKKPDEKSPMELEEEEEEEEEMAGPPKAMEEEEDEEEGDNDGGDSRPQTRLGSFDAYSDEEASDDGGPHQLEFIRYVPEAQGVRRQRHAKHKRSSGLLANNTLHDADATLSDQEANYSQSEDEKDNDANLAHVVSPTSVSKPRSRTNSIMKAPSNATVNATLDIPMAFSKPLPSSSIMGASSTVTPPSRSPSPASGSAVSSRSASPLEEEEDDDAEGKGKTPVPMDEADETVAPLPALSLSAPTDTHAVAAPADTDGDLDVDVDNPSPPEQEQDLEMETELESDLQPAHRAEALDVLAAIELRFALLRERVYVEKMDALAWEEALVADGNSQKSCTAFVPRS